MGKPRNTRQYPTYPEIPGNTRNTRKYPKVKKIPGNTRSYFTTLLPDPNPTRYPVFCPIPDPTRYWKNTTCWALHIWSRPKWRRGVYHPDSRISSFYWNYHKILDLGVLGHWASPRLAKKIPKINWWGITSLPNLWRVRFVTFMDSSKASCALNNFDKKWDWESFPREVLIIVGIQMPQLLTLYDSCLALLLP